MISIYSPPTGGAAILWAGIALLFSVISYFTLPSSKQTIASRKEKQAKLMREAYKNMEKKSTSSIVSSDQKSQQAVQIGKLYVYPIKSIRGCEVQSALLTREGFHLDRRFMLLKQTPATSSAPAKLDNMHVTKFMAMCLFKTSIKDNTLTVSYDPPSSPPPGLATKASSIDIPLEPENFEGLKTVEVNMHSSPTTALDMGEKYNAWFTACFGFSVVLAFWGFNPRLVLGNLPYQPATNGPKSLSASKITKVLSSLPVLGPMILPEDEGVIAFNDCAPYLVISDTSVTDVSKRLPESKTMDATIFRPNIIVTGSDVPYAEDYWSELTFSSPSSTESSGPKILLTGNCGRCASLNVDYGTGCAVAEQTEQPLKLLQKDRRVDPGMKYSPIFGRYGFVAKEDEGRVVRVGDRVVVSGVNEARTRFFWPGLST